MPRKAHRGGEHETHEQGRKSNISSRFFSTLLLSATLYILGQSFAYAEEAAPPAPEQVVVSPAQEAVNTALATATVEVTQAAAAAG